MRPKQIVKYSLIIFGTVIGLLAIVFTYQVIAAGEMKFEVPKNFRGLVTLEMSENGQLPSDWLKVPRNGVVKVSTFKLYSNYYKVRARWENGKNLEVVSSNNKNIEDLSFWTLPLRGDSKAFYFFVGTRQELREIWNDELQKKLYNQ